MIRSLKTLLGSWKSAKRCVDVPEAAHQIQARAQRMEEGNIQSFMLAEYEVLKDAWIHNEQGLDRAMDFFLTALSAGGAALVILYQAVSDPKEFYLGAVVILAIVFLISEISRWRLHSAIVHYSMVSRSLNAIKTYFSREDARARPYLCFWKHDDRYSGSWSQEDLDAPASYLYAVFRPYSWPIIVLNSVLSFCLATSLMFLLDSVFPLNTVFHWNIPTLFAVLVGIVAAIGNHIRQIVTGKRYLNRVVPASRKSMGERNAPAQAD